MVDLFKQIDLFFVVDFFQVLSYGSGIVFGEVCICKDVDMLVCDCDVLFIEDIVDIGYILQIVFVLFCFCGVCLVKFCFLLNKKEV